MNARRPDNRSKRRRSAAWLAAVFMVCCSLSAGRAQAHPLGQNAFNRDAAILVGPDRVQVEYLLDLAEIPTLAVGEEADTNRDGQVSDGEWAGYAERWARTLPDGLVVTAGGQRLPLSLKAQDWAVAPGQSGLLTLRLLARLEAPLALAEHATVLDYRDQTHADRLGWKEVWIKTADGVQLISADVPQVDRTKSMTDFTPRPEGPPTLISAHAEVLALAAANAPTTQQPAVHLLSIGAKAGAAQPVTSGQNLSIWAFFKLGLHHIATGWDHLMFLLGLVLISGSIKRLVKTVTAFTISHSVTLALAAKGLVQPPGPWVEALIAATIAYVGITALLRLKNNHGAWLAFGFGFIHGFGFAGALAESLGSTNNLRLSGLISFNMGIEAFQVSLVCAVLPLLALAARKPWYGGLYLTLASSVFLAGLIWFLLRTIGDGWPAALALLLISIATAALVIGTRRNRHRLTQA